MFNLIILFVKSFNKLKIKNRALSIQNKLCYYDSAYYFVLLSVDSSGLEKTYNRIVMRTLNL